VADDRTPQDGVDLEQMLDLATPWCLRVAATLRIPEHITAGHTDIDALVAATECDRDALYAVLGHLVSRGVFTEDSPGRFSCNQAAEGLAEAHRFIDLDGIGGRMAHTWGTLLDYVRTGQPSYEKVFGRPFWEDLAAHPRIAADFDALMERVAERAPARRLVTIEEVGAACAFLASQYASAMTGDTIYIDGGYHILG